MVCVYENHLSISGPAQALPRLFWGRLHGLGESSVISADPLTTYLLCPQVKCRNCGAFGHVAMSKWCPVKCWSRASAPPLLGSKEKENLEPRNPLALQTLGPFSKTDRKKEPGPR